MAIALDFVPYLRVDNFLGINAKDSDENILPGEWGKESINIVSNPKGALGSRNGYVAVGSGTGNTIGETTAWCGIYQYTLSSGVNNFIGAADDGKVYSFNGTSFAEIYSGLGDESIDDRYTFHQLNDICIITDGNNLPIKWTGSGSAATLGGSTVTADFGIEAWGYSWLHSTSDPRLLYYNTTLRNAESGYTSFINFDEDASSVTGACRQGDDMIVSKRFGLFRLRYTGTTEKFEKYRIPSKVGAVNHQVLKETPDGRVIFLAADFNLYMLAGESIYPVGNNIRPIIKAGKNSRINNAVAGILYDRSWYWLSFTKSSIATTNDTTIVLDYANPYQDKFGNLQYPCFVFSIGANCFAEIYQNGKTYLWSGGLTGQIYQQDYGTNDNGNAFFAMYDSPNLSLGDTTLNKKFNKLKVAYENKGSHNLSINLLLNSNAETTKTLYQSMLGGAGDDSIWDVAQFDVDKFSGETDIDSSLDIDRVGRFIKVSFITSGLNEAWNVLNYCLMAKGLKRS